MQTQQKKQIIAAISEQMTAKDLSQNKMANQLGISPAQLSNMFNEDKWAMVSDEKWAEMAGKVLANTTWKIVETGNYNRFIKACAYALAQHKLVAIAAHTGAGKTTALTKYNVTTPKTYYVHMRSSYGVRDLVWRIAEAMGIRANNGKTTEVEEQIVQRLRSEKALLMLDSVHKLRKIGAMEYIGDLAEAIEGKAGLVIAGTEALQQHIEKFADKNKAGYRELKRRIFTWQGAATQAEFLKDALAICHARGIFDKAILNDILYNTSIPVTCFGTLQSSIEQVTGIINTHSDYDNA